MSQKSSVVSRKVTALVPARDVGEELGGTGGDLEVVNSVAHLIVVGDVDRVGQGFAGPVRAEADGFCEAGLVLIEDTDDAAFFHQPNHSRAPDAARAAG